MSTRILFLLRWPENVRLDCFFPLLYLIVLDDLLELGHGTLPRALDEPLRHFSMLQVYLLRHLICLLDYVKLVIELNLFHFSHQLSPPQIAPLLQYLF